MINTIRIVFDNATPDQIEKFSDLITEVLELSGITAVQFVEELEDTGDGQETSRASQ